MVWVPLPTVKVCCTWGAALKLALPAWLASMTQVPAAGEGHHAAGDGAAGRSSASTVMVTARPEVAVAVGV